jgi:ribose 5-phosphate isomerase
MEYNIMAVKIDERRINSPDVQKVLSSFGCSIKMRLGLHETENVCSDEGLLILQLTGDTEEIKKLKKALNDMNGVEAKTISI